MPWRAEYPKCAVPAMFRACQSTNFSTVDMRTLFLGVGATNVARWLRTLDILHARCHGVQDIQSAHADSVTLGHAVTKLAWHVSLHCLACASCDGTCVANYNVCGREPPDDGCNWPVGVTCWWLQQAGGSNCFCFCPRPFFTTLFLRLWGGRRYRYLGYGISKGHTAPWTTAAGRLE